jgi:hypothetical protein
MSACGYLPDDLSWAQYHWLNGADELECQDFAFDRTECAAAGCAACGQEQQNDLQDYERDARAERSI